MQELLKALALGETTNDARKTKIRALVAFGLAPSIVTLYSVASAFYGDLPISSDDFGVLASWVLSSISAISTIVSTKTLGFKSSESKEQDISGPLNGG